MKNSIPFWLASAIALCSVVATRPAQGQIASDGTLSTNVQTTDNRNFNINNGNRAGNNLFHSFREFSVPTGGSAVFNNAVDIQNIINRVTGGSISNIDGLIKANGTANLFLINPNGIIFGRNASLSIGGSFVGSTASSLKFADGTVFSAKAPETNPLLTVNVPLGLQYGASAGSITNQSVAVDSSSNIPVGLQVKPGQNLALVGGDVSLIGGVLTASGGRVELGGLNGAGTVGLNGDGSLSYPAGVQRTNVSLTNGAGVDVTAGGGGSIAINARNLDISGGSSLAAGINPGLGAVGSKAGNIEINATDEVRISGETNFSGIVNQVGDPTGSTATLGSAGNIVINTGSLEGSGKYGIGSFTAGQGDAGSVTITASDKVSFSGGGVGSGVLSSVVGALAVGNGADININTRSLSLDNFAQLATSTLGGKGNAGNIQVNASGSVSVKSGSILQAASFGQGNAGSITIGGRDGVVPVVLFDGVRADGTPTLVATVVGSAQGFVGTGKGGDINITASSLSLTNGAQLNTGTSSGSGRGGNLSVNASDSVQVMGISADGKYASSLLATAEPGATGAAGNLSIATGKLMVSDGGQVSTSTNGPGQGGILSVNASDSVQVMGTGKNADGTLSSSQLFAATYGTGAAGDLTIDTGRLSIRDGAAVSADTFNEGNAGSLLVRARDLVEVVGKSSGSRSYLSADVNPEAKGTGGNLTIYTGRLSIRDGGLVSASTNGVGNAGSLTVQAADAVEVSGVSADSRNISQLIAQANQTAQGNGGNLTINTSSLSISGGAQVSSTTLGVGNAGNLTVKASDVELSGTTADGQSSSGLGAQVNSTGVGSGGNLTIETGRLSIRDGAFVSVDTFGQGNAGSSLVRARDLVEVVGTSASGSRSYLSANVNSGAKGTGGNLTIYTGRLSIRDGGSVSASTNGVGNAGSLTVQAADAVEVSGVSADSQNISQLLAQVDSKAQGNGGDLTINTGRLSLSGGGQVSTSTFGVGNAGNLSVNASDVELSGTTADGKFPSGLFADAEAEATGAARNLTITTGNLRVSSGAQVAVSTYGEGNAGNLNVNATGLVTISGSDSGLFANTATGSTGAGGSIFIDPRQLTLTDGAGIFVNSLGTGQGGNLQVQAGSISLDNGAFLSATANSGNGGDITLTVPDLLLMRHNSRISATAGTAGGSGNGGNITINTPFIVALPSENSDISADAFTGNGGKVTINAQSILGTQFREQRTPQSDITANSTAGGINGVVNIDRLDIDPSRTLVVLPTEIFDASRLIAQGCPAGGGQSSRFVVTGRGGMPPSPSQPLSDDNVLTNWATLKPKIKHRSGTDHSSNPTSPAPTQIVEAQGWIINNKGEVVLTAAAPTVTLDIPWLKPTTCHTP